MEFLPHFEAQVGRIVLQEIPTRELQTVAFTEYVPMSNPTIGHRLPLFHTPIQNFAFGAV